jgi:hypothetical protein
VELNGPRKGIWIPQVFVFCTVSGSHSVSYRVGIGCKSHSAFYTVGPGSLPPGSDVLATYIHPVPQLRMFQKVPLFHVAMPPFIAATLRCLSKTYAAEVCFRLLNLDLPKIQSYYVYHWPDYLLVARAGLKMHAGKRWITVHAPPSAFWFKKVHRDWSYQCAHNTINVFERGVTLRWAWQRPRNTKCSYVRCRKHGWWVIWSVISNVGADATLLPQLSFGDLTVVQLRLMLASGMHRDVTVVSACLAIQSTCHPRKKLRNWLHMQVRKGWNFSWVVIQTPTRRCGVAPMSTRGEKAYWTTLCVPNHIYIYSWTQIDNKCWMLHYALGA